MYSGKESLSIHDLTDFTDKFTYFNEIYETSILGLQNEQTYNQMSSLLFQKTSSLKMASNALELNHVAKALKILEDIFHILCYRRSIIKQELIDWLLMLHDFFQIWSESFEKGRYDVEPIDQYILNMVKTSSLSTTQKESSIKDKGILLYTKYTKIIDLFKKISSEFNSLDVSKSLASAEEYLNHKRIDFLFISSEVGIEEIILLQQICSTKTPNIIIVPILLSKDANAPENIRILNENNIHAFIHSKLDAASIIQTLQVLTKLSFDPAWISVPSSLILDAIDTIPPLPEVVIKLQELITSEESSNRDIANLLQTEPILTAKILHTINTPAFGMSEHISTLHHAVSLLGKSVIGALVLQEIVSDQCNGITLNMYGIDDTETFYVVSKERMELMSKWYMKINLGMMPVLATTALLGNIGMFILAAAAKKRGIEKQFSDLATNSNYRVAEAEFFNMTSEEVTALLLDHWKLDPLISHSIRYSFDFQNASADVKPFAIANFVIFNTLDFTEKADKDSFEDMCHFLKDLNLDSKHFSRTYKSIYPEF